MVNEPLLTSTYSEPYQGLTLPGLFVPLPTIINLFTKSTINIASGDLRVPAVTSPKFAVKADKVSAKILVALMLLTWLSPMPNGAALIPALATAFQVPATPALEMARIQ